jgi:hypothetical protein
VITRIGTNRAFVDSALKDALPDVESALWFAKALDFTASERSDLLAALFNSSDVIDALVNEGNAHSTELQDYLLELGYEADIEEGNVRFSTDVPQGEILPEVWESLQLTIADSIKEVCEALGGTIGRMPGKEGRMLMQSMMMMNAKRPILGDYKAKVQHESQVPNLWILDVSGSMTESTVRALVDEVVAGAYLANAHLAVVSDTTTFWGPGEYDSTTVLDVAEFSGTHYETLAPLFDQDWGVVVTIADFDSSPSALSAFRQAKGRVHEVFDISLVAQPTFLSQVIGVVANKVTPVMIARTDTCVMRGY